MKGRGAYKRYEELKAVGFLRTPRAERGLVAKHKGDLDNARRAGRHQGVSEHGMHHGAQRQVLRVRTHGPSRHDDDDGGNEIPPRPAVPGATQPHAEQAGAPPHDSHARVLHVVAPPRLAPAVLGEGVDAAPQGDDQAVEELLAPAGATQPRLADEQQDGGQDAICDERAAHDEMRQTLAEVVTAAVTRRGDAAKEHLHPRGHGQGLARDAMR